MKALTTHEAIKANLPDIYEQLEKDMLNKIRKHKNKDSLSLSPQDWQWSFDWGQRLQGFSLGDVMQGKTKTKEADTVEEKVYNFFKAGDLGVSIIVKNKTTTVSANFPSFTDTSFYVPQEIVNAYDHDGNAEILDKPTIFIYAKKSEQEAFRESYVIGGLKDIKTNKEYVVVKTLNNSMMAYFVSAVENNLDAFTMLSQSVEVKDFDKCKTIKIGKNSFYTQETEEALELLKGKTQWIEDSQSLVSMLLGELSKSPGFMSFGTPGKSSRITKLPFCTNVIYMNKLVEPEVKTKFKIR